jgi:hypothetical protein
MNLGVDSLGSTIGSYGKVGGAGMDATILSNVGIAISSNVARKRAIVRRGVNAFTMR